MRQRPSVTDVASVAGVSVGTVSNVLNRPDRVSGPTRARVEKAIADLGFVPSASARQLRAGVAQSVGAIVLDLANPFFTSVMRGIEDRLAEESLALMVSSTDDDPARETHFLRMYEQHEVRGILVTPVGTDHSELAAVRDRGTRVVLMDSDGDSAFPGVSVDDAHGGHLAVAHLLDLGRRRITFLNGPSTIRQCLDRLTGARRAVVDAGLNPDEVLTERVLPALNADAGEAAAHALLALPRSERPDAVFCVNDLVALGVLRTLLRAGVEVPQRIPVVGYDDIGFASMLMVPLTTIRQPTHQIGWSAADLLLRPQPESLAQVRFSPELVVRASSVAAG
ncbi:LacI family transcriptional regulator [Serinibacter arcticus]|uniref:LacI family transcriptional regulator n=1 Tax=Serinibacter arcticus TaxID=1655435 RepID=A0A2U1ZY04_9MICO|nr:LacI family DNA-binding transcriptional regulator [Serinibacter arcticus]PWD51875.1 LacI family transcriptional regulator [Serinibacter arcticus]